MKTSRVIAKESMCLLVNLLNPRPFVNTSIIEYWQALELALELASILHMYNKACKTHQEGYVTALYDIHLNCTAKSIYLK